MTYAMSFSLIYVTHAGEREADRMVEVLLEKKLIACGNIFPITSAYRWKGAVQHEGEWVSLLKTTPEMWDPLVKAIEQLHPYELPCIIKWEVTANPAYENWIRECVSPGSEP